MASRSSGQAAGGPKRASGSTAGDRTSLPPAVQQQPQQTSSSLTTAALALGDGSDLAYMYAPMHQITRQRQNIEYQLTIREQPKHSRMCGIGEKADRRPVDPAPIIQLRVITHDHPVSNVEPEVSPAQLQSSPLVSSAATSASSMLRRGVAVTTQHGEGWEDKAWYLDNPYYFMYAMLADCETDEELHLLSDGKTRYTTGSCVSCLYHLKDIDGSHQGFFVFPDLSIRVEGRYKLKLCLFETIGHGVHHCKSIYSDPFNVYTAKRFPGMEESTKLSRSFADQGLKVRVRKNPRSRKAKRASDESDGGEDPRMGKRVRSDEYGTSTPAETGLMMSAYGAGPSTSYGRPIPTPPSAFSGAQDPSRAAVFNPGPGPSVYPRHPMDVPSQDYRATPPYYDRSLPGMQAPGSLARPPSVQQQLGYVDNPRYRGSMASPVQGRPNDPAGGIQVNVAPVPQYGYERQPASVPAPPPAAGYRYGTPLSAGSAQGSAYTQQDQRTGAPYQGYHEPQRQMTGGNPFPAYGQDPRVYRSPVTSHAQRFESQQPYPTSRPSSQPRDMSYLPTPPGQTRGNPGPDSALRTLADRAVASGSYGAGARQAYSDRPTLPPLPSITGMGSPPGTASSQGYRYGEQQGFDTSSPQGARHPDEALYRRGGPGAPGPPPPAGVAPGGVVGNLPPGYGQAPPLQQQGMMPGQPRRSDQSLPPPPPPPSSGYR